MGEERSERTMGTSKPAFPDNEGSRQIAQPKPERVFQGSPAVVQRSELMPPSF